jgi:ABC-type antimicrobial peptide transport system permease subunit
MAIRIAIYARTFADKGKIAAMLDDYNDQMKEAGEDDKVIVYTDVIAAMMDSITNIISTVSEILIGFVAISLVVSSIMIGVITYISVLERRKEIGVLRALGASRHNIREVFDAETIITGLLSGLLGIGFTFLLIPLADYLIWRHTGQIIHAWLTLPYAVGLVALSTVLTTIAGLIPSAKAARSDPVKALRTE